MVNHAIFKNISVFLVEETEVPGENHNLFDIFLGDCFVSFI
jgi:hypothetical protein